MHLTTNTNAIGKAAVSPLSLGGSWTWQRVSFGLLFLVFLLPLPQRFATLLAGPLQSVAMSASTYLLQTLGYPAIAEENVILVQESRIGVAEAFRGLQMFVSFFAVSTVAALIVSKPFWERVLIVLSAIPIAIFCNVARVVGAAIVLENVGNVQTQELLRNLSDWLMLPLAVAVLLVELWILSRLLIAPPDRDVVPVGSRRASAADGRYSKIGNTVSGWSRTDRKSVV